MNKKNHEIMKKSISLLLFMLCLMAGLTAHADNLKKIEVNTFNAMRCEGVSTIHFTQGDTYKVDLKESKDIVTHISVKGKTLMISTENTDKKSRGHKDTESPELWVTAPQLKSLEIGGAVTFDAKDIQGPSLAIEVEGVSKVSLDRVKGDVVELNVSGVCSYKGNIEGGSVTVNNAGSGSIKSDIQTDNLLLNNSGATTFKGNFKGKEATVTNSGVGNITLNVDCNKLTASNDGVGKLRLSGTADDTNIDGSGVSEIDSSHLNNL